MKNKVVFAFFVFFFISCGGDSSSGSLSPEEPSSEDSSSETLSSSSKDSSSSTTKNKPLSSSIKINSSSSLKKESSSSMMKGKSSSSSVKNESSSSKPDVSSSSLETANSSSEPKGKSSSSSTISSSSSEKKDSSSSVKSSSSIKPEESSSSEDKSSSSVKPKESSSSEYSSSSVIETSSSSLVATGVCKTAQEDNCVYDTLYDDHDGQTYKIVKIGEQWWMAENLRYVDSTQSVCYANNSDNCQIYGRLYTRNGAINDCPNGWHLPTEKEWLKLQEYIKENSHSDKNNVGQYLRADSLWDVSGLGVGYDAFGFSALPGGVKDRDGWWGVEKHALFWLSDSYKNGSDDCYVYAQIRYKLKNDSDMQIGKTGNICDLYPSSKYSVRCIKD